MDNSSRINSNLGTYTDAVIYENDPLWNKQKFIELVNVGFFKIQNAWCSGEMSGAQEYISDGILRRFNMQLEPYRAKNQKNVLGQLSLDNVQILEIHKDELYTYIATLITATCTDTIVDFDTNEVVEKNYGGELTTWREKWIWMRSNAAKTEETENGVFADKCPNCGATLKINAVGKCEYCLSELTK
jgi:predicted lipid-binding transport protein (Tim44 family)